MAGLAQFLSFKWTRAAVLASASAVLFTGTLTADDKKPHVAAPAPKAAAAAHATPSTPAHATPAAPGHATPATPSAAGHATPASAGHAAPGMPSSASRPGTPGGTAAGARNTEAWRAAPGRHRAACATAAAHPRAMAWVRATARQ